MQRFENWPRLLTEFLANRRAMPFAWGVNDCLIFCADAIQTQTGQDLAADVRGTYTDEAGANALVASMGANIEDILTARLGPSKELGFAQRGDVVSYASGGRVCGGVVDETGRRAAVLFEGRGLLRIPLAECQKAWSV